MTTPYDEFLVTKSPPSAGSSLPLLDLYNLYTLAQEVLDDPAGRHVRRNAGQIVRECRDESTDERATEPATIIGFAERIRAAGATEGDRSAAAAEMLEYLDGLIDRQLAELGLARAGDPLPGRREEVEEKEQEVLGWES